MIYAVHWAAVTRAPFSRFYELFLKPIPMKKWLNKTINGQEILANQIKSSKDDSFTFIITGSQEPLFEKWIKDFNLDKYIMYKQPYQVTNPVHPGIGRNLRLYVLQSKNHFQQELVK